MSASCSAHSSACTMPAPSREPASASPRSSASSPSMVVASGRRAGRRPAPPSTSPLPPEDQKMRENPILLVEDNADDEALTLRAFAKNKITNPVTVVRDGAEALDYLFRAGAYAGVTTERPQVVLLDLKLPKIDGIEVL